MGWITGIAALAAAAVDMRRREIPDVIPIALLLAALVAACVGQPPGWSSRLIGFGSAFLVGAGLFYAGGFGGGDVKLLAAIGLALGVGELSTVLFWTAMAGAVHAVLAKRRGAEEIAYAPSIAVGVGITLLARLVPLLGPFRPWLPD